MIRKLLATVVGFALGALVGAHAQDVDVRHVSVTVGISSVAPPTTDVPPGTEPEAGDWQLIVVGDATTSGTLTENSVSHIICGGDGSGDGLATTTTPISGSICYLPAFTGDRQIIARLTSTPWGGHTEDFTFAHIGFVDTGAAISGNSNYGFCGIPFNGFGDQEVAAKSRMGGGAQVNVLGVDTTSPTDPIWIARVEMPSLGTSTTNTWCFIAPDVAGSPGTWTQATTPQTLTLPSSGYPVVYHTSHSVGMAGTVEFDNISISEPTLVGGEPPVTTALGTAPWYNFGGISVDHFLQNSSSRAEAAKFHSFLGSGYWEGAWTGQSLTHDQVVQDIQSRGVTNGTDTQWWNYHLPNEAPFPNVVYPSLNTIATSTGCWAYLNGTSGPIAPSIFDPAWDYYNLTAACPGVGGDSFPEDVADFIYDHGFNTGGSYSAADAAPTTNCVLLDNHFPDPRANWDFDRDGTTDSNGDADFVTSLRVGWDEMRDRFKSLDSTMMVGGNQAWYLENDITPLSDLGDCGFVEAVTGLSWSATNWYSGQQVLGLMARAVRQLAADAPMALGFVAPHYTLTATANDYREIAYYCGLAHIVHAVCSMQRGYTSGWYDSSAALAAIQSITVLEEFSQSGDLNWLGEVESAPPDCNVATLDCTADSYQNSDTYIVEFENGTIACNVHGSAYSMANTMTGQSPTPPTDNKTITLPYNVTRINGSQQSVNTGASHTAGTNITIPERTCIWFHRP